MVTEFLIAGAGLYMFRTGQKLYGTLKEKLKLLKHKDLIEVNKMWYLMLHNAGVVNKQGATFNIINAKEVDYGYHLLLSIPPGMNFEDINKIRPTIENNFGAVAILTETKSKKNIIAEIYDNVPDRVNFTPVKTKPYEIFLGLEYSGKPVIMDMSKYFNLIIGGVVGTGKSRLLYIIGANLIANFTPEQVELFSFQTEKSDLNILAKCEHMKMFATTLEETYSLLDKISRIIDSRNNKLKEIGALDINEYNKETKNKKLSRIYVFGEECSFLMGEDGDTEDEIEVKNKIKKMLRRILRTGRYVGINVLLVTQRATSEMIDPSIKTNMCRVTGRQMSTINSTNIIETSDAVGLKNGEFILMSDGYTRFRTPIIDKNIIKDLIGGKPQQEPQQEVIEDIAIVNVEDKINFANDISELDPKVFHDILESRNRRKAMFNPIKEEPTLRLIISEVKEESKQEVIEEPKKRGRKRKNTVEVAATKEG